MTASLHVLVSAGPTREYIDPVRFISNPSSGKMGYAVAEAALRKGFRVTLVSGPTHLTPPAGAALVPVTTALEMKDAVTKAFPACDALIMTAAVSDYRPAKRLHQKLHKTAPALTLELQRNPDIIREVLRQRTHQVVIGFAAETDDMLASAAQKLESKGMDMIIANDVSRAETGFGSDMLDAVALFRSGERAPLGLVSKQRVAEYIVEQLKRLVQERQRNGA